MPRESIAEEVDIIFKNYGELLLKDGVEIIVKYGITNLYKKIEFHHKNKKGNQLTDEKSIWLLKKTWEYFNHIYNYYRYDIRGAFITHKVLDDFKKKTSK